MKTQKEMAVDSVIDNFVRLGSTYTRESVFVVNLRKRLMRCSVAMLNDLSTMLISVTPVEKLPLL